MNKSHLLFKNPAEGVVTYRGRLGGGDDKNKDEEKEIPDYTPMANVFRVCMADFYEDIEYRHSNRILNFNIHFDLIELTFQGSFNQEKFQGHYISNFGLLPVRFSLFNRKGLFAIEDREKFNFFILQLKNFIARYIDETEVDFDGKIKYIKSFKLFSS